MVEITNILEVENYISDVDAVIFDLDDTLYSEKEYVRSGFVKIEEHLGISGISNEMWSLFESGAKPIDSIVEKYSLQDKKEDILRIYRFQNPDIHLYAGVYEMLERIKIDRKVGIITDGRPEGQRAKIKALGLDRIIENIIITDELGGVEYRKPNPLAFLIIQSRFEVQYEHMIYIGDNLKKDFMACEHLGMRWIYYNNGDGLYR